MYSVGESMKPLELVILVGIQASGKTTFYRRHLADRFAHISLDHWRGKGNARAKEQRAIRAGLEAAAEAGEETDGVVVDNTNITAETRRRYFQYAEEAASRSGREVRPVAYFFDADLAGCLRRNQQRPKDAPVGEGYYVPPVAIHSFHRRLQVPDYEEGFDRILHVRITETGEFAIEEMPCTRA